MISFGTQVSHSKILSIFATTLVCEDSIPTLYFMNCKSSVSNENLELRYAMWNIQWIFKTVWKIEYKLSHKYFVFITHRNDYFVSIESHKIYC